MKKSIFRKYFGILLLAVLTVSVFMFTGCDGETIQKTSVNEFLTASAISYTEAGEGKIAVGSDADGIFKTLSNDDPEDDPDILVKRIEFAVAKSGKLKEMSFMGITAAPSAYYYNDSGIEIPSGIQSDEAREEYLASKAKTELNFGTDGALTSSELDIKIANNSNYKSYILVDFTGGNSLGQKITVISGELDVKIASMGDNAVSSLKLMGYGMLAIFLVIIAIMIIVYVLNYVSSKRMAKQEQSQDKE